MDRLIDVESLGALSGQLVVVFGRRAAGKTTFIREVLHRFMHRRRVFNGKREDGESGTIVTANGAEEYEDRARMRLPGTRKAEVINWDGDRVDGKAVVRAVRDFANAPDKSFLVLDNCCGDVRPEELWTFLVASKRAGALVVLALPYAPVLSDENRRSVDVVVMFPDDNPGNRKRLWNFCGTRAFATFERFNHVLDEIGERHNGHDALVIFRRKETCTNDRNAGVGAEEDLAARISTTL